MNKRQCHRARKRNGKLPLKSERVQIERHHGGPTWVVGRPARYRSGRGIARAGDSRNGHGTVRVLVKNGVIVGKVDPACCFPCVSQPANQIAA